MVFSYSNKYSLIYILFFKNTFIPLNLFFTDFQLEFFTIHTNLFQRMLFFSTEVLMLFQKMLGATNYPLADKNI